jgi:hypothetical protein
MLQATASAVKVMSCCGPDLNAGAWGLMAATPNRTALSQVCTSGHQQQDMEVVTTHCGNESL